MRVYFFTLRASYQVCEKLYLRTSNSVLLRAESGETIQLPSLNLRPFVTRLGLNGRFRLIITDDNKVKSFEKVN